MNTLTYTYTFSIHVCIYNQNVSKIREKALLNTHKKKSLRHIQDTTNTTRFEKDLNDGLRLTNWVNEGLYDALQKGNF